MIIYIFGAIQLENRFHPPPQYGKSKKKNNETNRVNSKSSKLIMIKNLNALNLNGVVG